MSEEVSFWVATRRGNSLILLEQGLKEKIFALNLKTDEFSIIRQGKRVDLGKLLRVDLSAEALIEDVEIREGDRILLFPAPRVGQMAKSLAP